MDESIEARQENCLRVVWGLLRVRECLHEYVGAKSEQQYQVFKKTVMKECKNQTCNKCQVNSKCENGSTKVTGKSPFRQGHFCDEMKKQIQGNHVKKKPSWVNTDSTQWHDPDVGHWEVTKCYLSTSGYLKKTKPNHVDASGLLSICINSSLINQHISNIHHFEEVRSIRNETLHDPNYECGRQTAEDCLDKMIDLLQDPQELVDYSSSKDAVDHIRNIKKRAEKIPAFMSESLEKRLQPNFDVESALRETEDRMFERLRKELKEELTNFIAQDCNALCSLLNSQNVQTLIYCLPTTISGELRQLDGGHLRLNISAERHTERRKKLIKVAPLPGARNFNGSGGTSGVFSTGLTQENCTPCIGALHRVRKRTNWVSSKKN